MSLAPNESVREFTYKSLKTETKEEESVKIKIIDNQEAVAYCSILWPSALVLALYLWEHRSVLSGKYILELGSGTALPGILAAKCGGNVTLSESALLPRSIANLKRTCELNDLVGQVQVIGLTWGLFTSDVLQLKPLDLIIASDCFYDPSVFDDILATVSFLIDRNPKTEFLTTYQERSSDWSIEPLLHKWQLACSSIAIDNLGAESDHLKTMDKKHVAIILNNVEELVDVTHQVDDIIGQLEERKILNDMMVKYLMMSSEHRKKLRNFYELIQGRGPTAFDHLLQVLRKTQNFRAENLLTKDNLTVHASILDPIVEPINIPEDVFDGVLESELNVKVHPQGKFMDNDEENQPSGTYRMRSKPRGHALIININKTLHLDDRRGSEVDQRKLNKLFKDLGYKVVSCSNLNLKEMKATIVDFSSDPALANIDSTVVFIMSHGEQLKPGERSVDLITSDGEKLSTKYIVDQFFSDDSKFTKVDERKPKLFFFQACRVMKNAGDKNIRYRSEVETDSLLLSNGHCPARKHEDTFQIFSTIGGYPSMRDRSTGAWFVDKFCEIVAENAWQYDLDTMLGLVDEKVRKMSSRTYGYQTIEVLKQGVSKKLFFNPGL